MQRIRALRARLSHLQSRLPAVAQGIELVVVAIVLDYVTGPLGVAIHHAFPVTSPFSPHLDFLATIDSTIVGVAITLLGLYFAAICVVASVVYPGSFVAVRAVLLEDRKPRALMNSLVRLAAYGTVILVAEVMGSTLSLIATAILLVLSLKAFSDFLIIAPIALDYLDPQRAINQVADSFVARYAGNWNIETENHPAEQGIFDKPSPLQAALREALHAPGLPDSDLGATKRIYERLTAYRAQAADERLAPEAFLAGLAKAETITLLYETAQQVQWHTSLYAGQTLDALKNAFSGGLHDAHREFVRQLFDDYAEYALLFREGPCWMHNKAVEILERETGAGKPPLDPPLPRWDKPALASYFPIIVNEFVPAHRMLMGIREAATGSSRIFVAELAATWCAVLVTTRNIKAAEVWVSYAEYILKMLSEEIEDSAMNEVSQIALGLFSVFGYAVLIQEIDRARPSEWSMVPSIRAIAASSSIERMLDAARGLFSLGWGNVWKPPNWLTSWRDVELSDVGVRAKDGSDWIAPASAPDVYHDRPLLQKFAEEHREIEQAMLDIFGAALIRENPALAPHLPQECAALLGLLDRQI